MECGHKGLVHLRCHEFNGGRGGGREGGQCWGVFLDAGRCERGCCRASGYEKRKQGVWVKNSREKGKEGRGRNAAS